jgi:hypothetical protein
MNRVTEQELVDRLDAGRALATKIAHLQDAVVRLKSAMESGHAVEITIESHTTQPVKLQASTSSLTPFEPTEMHCILSSALSTVERKLTELKQEYEDV